MQSFDTASQAAQPPTKEQQFFYVTSSFQGLIQQIYLMEETSTPVSLQLIAIINC